MSAFLKDAMCFQLEYKCMMIIYKILVPDVFLNWNKTKMFFLHAGFYVLLCFVIMLESPPCHNDDVNDIQGIKCQSPPTPFTICMHINTNLIWAVKKQNFLDTGYIVHFFVPTIKVVFVAWKSINQEILLLAFCHRLLERHKKQNLKKKQQQIIK